MGRTIILSSLMLGAAACVVNADGDDCEYEETYSCYVEYTPGYGYARVCDWVIDPLVCIDFDDDDDSAYSGYRRRPSSSAGAAGEGGAGAAGSAGSSGEGGSAGSSAGEPRDDLECARDAQCGTGLCIDGSCFYGCAEDVDCGTGDSCLAVNDTLVCQVPETPVVECERSADCGFGQVCLNATCHDSCEETSDCNNELDRCVDAICVPDRRVVAECLLDRECPDGQVCIDATCQPR